MRKGCANCKVDVDEDDGKTYYLCTRKCSSKPPAKPEPPKPKD